MARGYVWAEYISDAGQTWALRVDADMALDPARGWVIADPTQVPPFPRGWLPRIVIGLDEGGKKRQTRVGTNTCDLWTGVVNTFMFEGNDGVLYEARVTERRRERTRHDYLV